MAREFKLSEAARDTVINTVDLRYCEICRTFILPSESIQKEDRSYHCEPCDNLQNGYISDKDIKKVA